MCLCVCTSLYTHMFFLNYLRIRRIILSPEYFIVYFLRKEIFSFIAAVQLSTLVNSSLLNNSLIYHLYSSFSSWPRNGLYGFFFPLHYMIQFWITLLNLVVISSQSLSVWNNSSAFLCLLWHWHWHFKRIQSLLLLGFFPK